MKCLGVSLLALLFALSVKTSAQDNPLSKAGQGVIVVIPGENQGSCPDYKIGIITPPKDVDFKMKLLTPSENIDPGIIFKLCGESSHLSSAPQISMPQQGINPFF